MSVDLRHASPMTAIAVAMLPGAAAGLDELEANPERDLVARHPYALALYAELHASLGHLEEARVFLDRALAQQASPAERELLRGVDGEVVQQRQGRPPPRRGAGQGVARPEQESGDDLEQAGQTDEPQGDGGGGLNRAALLSGPL
jgi:hypothetical protein